MEQAWLKDLKGVVWKQNVWFRVAACEDCHSVLAVVHSSSFIIEEKKINWEPLYHEHLNTEVCPYCGLSLRESPKDWKVEIKSGRRYYAGKWFNPWNWNTFLWETK